MIHVAKWLSSLFHRETGDPGLVWLRRPLVSQGALVAPALDPERLTDTDLGEICFRMHVILASIENQRAEGRCIPLVLFDAIDTLDSVIVHGTPLPSGYSNPPRLIEWIALIREFGAHYHLNRRGPINIDEGVYRDESKLPLAQHRRK